MSVRASDCACIILASGLSQRFGSENKLLADLGEKPVIAYTLDVARDVGFKEVFVVCPVDERLTTIINFYDFTRVENKTPERGQGATLALGADAVLSHGYRTACIMLADMPFVKSFHINELLDNFSGKNALFSKSEDVAMPPAIFNHDALLNISDLEGDTGGKNKVKRDLQAALTLSHLAARDIDTPEDLEEMRELLNLL